MHALTRGTLLLVALASSLPPLAAQPAPDTARLRHALAGALGADFEIVRTELRSDTRERSGTFWLAHLRPLRSGDYRLVYTYEFRDRARPGDPLYSHVEHSSVLRVGEAGCWRRHEGRDACLGDVLIVPVVAGDHVGAFTGHTFEVARRGDAGPARPSPAPAEATPGADALPNPAAPHLRYLGTRVEEMPHARLGATTVHHATFEAGAPGAFNLGVGVDGAGPAGPGEDAGSTPIVVVPRGHPVTVLLANERVRSYQASGRFASHRGNQYLTSVLLLQPGDRVSLQYRTSSVRGREPSSAEREEARRISPTVTVHPFRMDASDRFNGWIADHLPSDP
jgi:hypothetical protein